MSRQERYGTRDLTFSQRHRTLHDDCTCIDIDFSEYCSRCGKTLALIETARQNGRPKATTVIRNLAKRAGVDAFLVRFELDESHPDRVSECTWQKVFPDVEKIQQMDFDGIGRKIEEIHLSCCSSSKTVLLQEHEAGLTDRAKFRAARAARLNEKSKVDQLIAMWRDMTPAERDAVRLKLKGADRGNGSTPLNVASARNVVG